MAAPSPTPASATNYLDIRRTSGSIEGTYSIDPSKKMPGIDPPLDAEGNKLNMRLHTTSGSINATAQLIRAQNANRRALFETTSKSGSVAVTVHDKALHRFRLLATSTSGSVTLRIPSTFTGPVTASLTSGSLSFTSAVQGRLTTLSENDGESRYFIGDYDGSGYEDEESWTKDALRVASNSGSVNIAFAGW